MHPLQKMGDPKQEDEEEEDSKFISVSKQLTFTHKILTVEQGNF